MVLPGCKVLSDRNWNYERHSVSVSDAVCALESATTSPSGYIFSKSRWSWSLNSTAWRSQFLVTTEASTEEPGGALDEDARD